LTDIADLQDLETGTFAGDSWGEKDTRFLYGAFNALSLLGLMHMIDVDKAVAHVKSCENVDGAFGTSPGAESHSGQVFTCVGALAIAGRLDLVDADKLGGWLSERQLPNGGLNGRPEKLEDVCYSWWVMTSMAMIGRLHWIDQKKIAYFILSCQVRIHSHGSVTSTDLDAGPQERRLFRQTRRHGRCLSHNLRPCRSQPCEASGTRRSRSSVVSLTLYSSSLYRFALTVDSCMPKSATTKTLTRWK